MVNLRKFLAARSRVGGKGGSVCERGNRSLGIEEIEGQSASIFMQQADVKVFVRRSEGG